MMGVPMKPMIARKRGLFYGRVTNDRPFEEVLIEYLSRGAAPARAAS